LNSSFPTVEQEVYVDSHSLFSFEHIILSVIHYFRLSTVRNSGKFQRIFINHKKEILIFSIIPENGCAYF